MFEIAAPLRWTLGGIYGTLTFAGLTTGLLARIRPKWELSEVATRIKTWWAMAIVFTIALVAGQALSIALFTIVSLLALREFHRLTAMTDHIAVPISMAAAVAAYGLVAIGYPAAGWLVPIVTATTIFPIALALGGRTEGFTATVAAASLGLLLSVWGPLHAVLLLVRPTEEAAGGAGLLVFLVLVTEIGDVAQFLSGKAFGRTSIAPMVSPNKTRGGLIGGIIVAAAIGFELGPLLTPLNAALSAATGAALAAFGFAGDLVISAVKRDCGVKDTGTLLPGHGGVLDRIDSLIATAPVFALVVFLVS